LRLSVELLARPSSPGLSLDPASAVEPSGPLSEGRAQREGSERGGEERERERQVASEAQGRVTGFPLSLVLCSGGRRLEGRKE
jgi:hypothetical protein